MSASAADSRSAQLVLNIYVGLFVLYLFLPLAVMSAAAFNSYDYPSVTQWRGFTLEWFVALAHDQRLLQGLVNSVLVALGVIVVSIPAGLSGALILTRLGQRSGTMLYSVLVSPVLTPGIILGISSLIFWRQFGVAGGLFVAVMAQSSFIASYAMLLFLARLQRQDRTLEEAALDLGASHTMVFRRITLPFLAPTCFTAAVVAFLQSFENYNTTVFAIGGEWTLVTEIASRMRFGLSPVINVVGVIFVVVTLLAATSYVVLRGKPKR
ncbi:ABC transporter permease subunit [Ancylobacter sp. MQZ15Z-1]|uniref:ABC transporter permease subunit n=1 Tax=Ancylobacter mangrovi TaxID=2972472 RepID=A0A9X2T4Z7_9HYPH|nr:ABC transporter permease subunit [Ancylobacter mangrovi]MCS0493493.1 ABC transporter permease subunit [Ancylobacter mangrovi]